MQQTKLTNFIMQLFHIWDRCIMGFVIWVRLRNCGCLVTWFCYQLIAKPDNKTTTIPWSDPYWSVIILDIDTTKQRKSKLVVSWWRHQMETFSALLALCAGTSPVPVNSPHKGQWRGALMFSLICAQINDSVNNREAGDLRRHRGHYDVRVMIFHRIYCFVFIGLTNPICVLKYCSGFLLSEGSGLPDILLLIFSSAVM